MFGLGLIETGVVLFLGYLAFRHFIARRWPGASKAVAAIFYISAALMLGFGLLTHFSGQ